MNRLEQTLERQKVETMMHLIVIEIKIWSFGSLTDFSIFRLDRKFRRTIEERSNFSIDLAK